MSCKKTSICLSHPLWEGAVAQATARGYESLSAYVVALLRLDTINDTAVDHQLAHRIADMGDRKRDLIDSRVKEKAEEALAQWSFVEAAGAETVNQLLAEAAPGTVVPFAATA